MHKAVTPVVIYFGKWHPSSPEDPEACALRITAICYQKSRFEVNMLMWSFDQQVCLSAVTVSDMN